MNKHLQCLLDGTLAWLTANLERFDLPAEEGDRRAGKVLIDPRARLARRRPR